MAHLLVTTEEMELKVGSGEVVERLCNGHGRNCLVWGKPGTYSVHRSGDDAIACLGYACFSDAESMDETLAMVLGAFEEAQIGHLKKRLLGQYAMVVIKNGGIFLFGDFLGGRNVFYTDDGKAVCSSFKVVEDLIGTCTDELDHYKVLEFLAMRHILYPTFLGNGTIHKRIQWLLPYEYLALARADASFQVGSSIWSIDASKEADCDILADKLLNSLREVVGRKELGNSSVAASLTGGRDSRLMAAVVAERFPHVHFRTSVSAGNPDSARDQAVASRLAQICGVPLDVYTFVTGRDEARFEELTEGFAPYYNHSITPLIDGAGAYSVGIGGVFGTELFVGVVWRSVDEFVRTGIARTRAVLRVEESFWARFRESLHAQFAMLRQHFELAGQDDRDLIRMFNLLVTARYGSFILSAFNRNGREFEPYGTYPIVELALRVAPELWGDHRRLSGNALVQRAAMARLHPRMARVLTYRTFRPMVPFSPGAFPRYAAGYGLHVAHWLRERLKASREISSDVSVPGARYSSDGWERLFITRTLQKYGWSGALGATTAQ